MSTTGPADPEAAGSTTADYDVGETTTDTSGVEESTAGNAQTATGGVRARLAIHNPPSCTVAATLEDGATATDVRRAEGNGEAVEQFRSSRQLAVDPVFEAGGEYVYRVADDGERNCPCRLIESLGYPIDDVAVRTNPTRLVVSLVLPSPEPIAEVVTTLEETGASVRLECLVRSIPEDGESVVVDTGRLTDRQQEVLEVAYRMGYFAYPREHSAEEVAAELGIVRSTFAEHLAAAQGRLFDGIFRTG